MSYDGHIHIALDGADWKTALARHAQGPSEAAVRQALATYQEAGCTYLRDGGDKQGVGLLAAQLAPDYGISFASPGFAIHKRGTYGGFLGRAFETLDDFKALVDEAAENGATFIKVMLTGILDFGQWGVITDPLLPFQLVRDMVKYAHEQGFSVMAHTNGAVAVQQALEAGVDSIEHGFYLNEGACQNLAHSGAIWVPTFAPIEAQLRQGNGDAQVLQRILDYHVEAVRLAASLGAVIACGTDAGSGGVPHGACLDVEHFYLQQALGSETDAALARGLAALQEKFPGA